MPRDPVCGKYVHSDTAYRTEVDGEDYCFCSKDCMEEFEYNAQVYLEFSQERVELEE